MAYTNEFVYPSAGLLGKFANWLVSCRLLLRFRRALFSHLPFLKLASDVTNVVYCTWVVDVRDVSHLVPTGVVLKQRNGSTLFTILTYAHGHFGPRIAGPLRRVFPSPLQSNWRLYVETLPGNVPTDKTVLFVKNIFDNPLYAIGTRLFSDALPSHVAGGFEHTVSNEQFATMISAGAGSAPEFRCVAGATSERSLFEAFAPFFDSWRSAVTFLCLQHSAVAQVEDCDRLAYAAIDLPVDTDTVAPLASVDLPVSGEFLRQIGATGRPLCFLVPSVPFCVLSERLL
ncbi:DUF2071 domain-containing protein [Dyella sp. Tek66A03]|uniref:DUF2071 domain-containing protein n=1 Tax=Dyella sp. Tek66A03 TaxID=3458298 RepID=UPI00403EF0EA